MSESKRGKRVALLSGSAVAVVLLAAGWAYRDEVRFWWRFEAMGSNPQGCREFRHRRTGIVFVALAGGTFAMGSPETEKGRFDWEGPVHEVRLRPFMIAKYEVTQAEWSRVMGDNPSQFKGENLPVESVSWEECQEFCEKTGLKLPTEAQWEYACRARKDGPYGGTGKLDEMGWYDDNSGGKTHPVGEKEPNAFGLHDMHGNVWEWCEDVFDDAFYARRGARGTDPLCTTGSEFRVLRGGSWVDLARYCRSADRGRGHPSFRCHDVGFRPSGPSPSP